MEAIQIGTGGSLAWRITNYQRASGVPLSETATPAANTSTSGIAELATDAEALAGTDATRIVTSASLASSKSLGSIGFQKFPGGLEIKWGVSDSVANDNSLTITYATAFTTATYSVVITGNGGLTIAGQGEDTVDSISASQFIIRHGQDGARTFNWIAIGK